MSNPLKLKVQSRHGVTDVESTDTESSILPSGDDMTLHAATIRSPKAGQIFILPDWPASLATG
jgi:hypothetical protein